jgi:hypothetical protein
MSRHTLEPAAQEIADATSKPPLLCELGPEGARTVLDDIRAAPVDKPLCDGTHREIHFREEGSAPMPHIDGPSRPSH